MFIKTLDKNTASRLRSYGAKEVKQNNNDFYIFMYDKDVLVRYNEKFNQKNILFTDKLYFV